MKKVLGLYRYVWLVSGRAQIILIALSVFMFLLDLAPLELQRRIINGAVGHQPFAFLAILCLVYIGAVLVQGGTKLLFYSMSTEARSSRRRTNDCGWNRA